MSVTSDEKRKRYHALAVALLGSPEPVTAIAEMIGDHEGRLDALAERIAAVEASVSYIKNVGGRNGA
jgi:hypothetical protein